MASGVPLQSSLASGPRQASGLGESDFRLIAANGFSDGWNAYAHTMAWFDGHLYVGTTRANLCGVKIVRPPAVEVWPIRCPDDIYEIDRRAQIWRYHPQRHVWKPIFVSPLVDGSNGRKVPREIGYRGMTVFQGKKDPRPALYVCNASPSMAGRPATILRTVDGTTFVPVTAPIQDPALNTYRALTAFKGRLYTSPAGRTAGWKAGRHRGLSDSMSGHAVILESPDPSSEPWRPVNSPGFGDPTNGAVFDMAVFDGFLYAGTVNPKGCQLWKTDASGEPPYAWVKVLGEGAGRGKLNEGIASLCVFDGALYCGTGIQHGGYDRTYKIGPAAAELIRVHPDDSWDLIVGSPRRTPVGWKVPLSDLAPGFGNLFNGYFWNMCVHDGWLYVGTYDWSVLLSYLPLDKWPDKIARLVRSVGPEELVEREGGFDLWRSATGIDWQPVTRTGFGNPYSFGVRKMVSTPSGLFVGTANPFGPEVAVKTGDGWKYEANPRGGLEVWLGSRPPVTPVQVPVRSRDLGGDSDRLRPDGGRQ